LKLSIEYCSMWNYLPKASSLKAELEQNFPDLDISLISSGGGVFEVILNSKLIFSKKALNRFPEKGEVAKLINNYWIFIHFAD